MAIQGFKVALNAARFPPVSTKGQRAVLVPGLDSAPRTPRSFMGAEESVDYNLAQILYGENIMPLASGIKSVGYEQLVAPTVTSDFDQLFALRDANEDTVLYSPSAGKNYIYDSSSSSWTSTTFLEIHGVPLSGASQNTEATAKLTYAYVDGKTFVCYSRLIADGGTDASILYWDPVTLALTPAGALIANLPFAAGTIDGISSSNGYLIVYSDITVAWAAFNGTAFDYTLYANGEFTGSGAQIPEDVQGTIKACVSLPGGFVIFTSKNAIAASYHAQNLVAPWIFREISGAGGLKTYEQSTIEGSLGAIIAYTTTGLQRVSLNSSEESYPDVSDFIAGRQLETYSLSTHTTSISIPSTDLATKISNIANRYLVVSYGTFPGAYTYALVYDLTLKRWGKLKINHVDCFYYSYLSLSSGLTYEMTDPEQYDSAALSTYDAAGTQSGDIAAAQHCLAFLQSDGRILVADWSSKPKATEDAAVAVIGRVQLTRSSHTQFNRAEIERMTSGRVYLQPSYGGADLAAPEQLIDIEVSSDTDYRIVGGMIDCNNFNIVLEGTFDLSTIILEATTSGRV